MTPGKILAEILNFLIVFVGRFLGDFKELSPLLQHKHQALHNVVNLAFSVVDNAATVHDISVRAINAEQIWIVGNQHSFVCLGVFPPAFTQTDIGFSDYIHRP